MKIWCRLILMSFLVLAAPAFAQDEAVDGRLEAFTACVSAMKDIFTQSMTLAGKDGVRVTCTLMPTDEIVSAAWKIENPGGALLTVRAGDVRLYSGEKEFAQVPTDQAVEIMDTWPNEENTRTASGAIEQDLQPRPGEIAKEALMYRSAFRFGSASDTVITGITYFSCRLKDLPGVTAEIKVNGQAYAFAFDGVGP